MNIPNKRFLTFVLIGIFSTLFDAVIFTTLISVFGKDVEKIVMFNMMSFSIVVLCSFFLNGKLTFKDNDLTPKKLMKYYSSSSIGMGLNTVIVLILLTMIGFGTIVSKIIAACIIVFYNYSMSKKFIFESKS